MSDARACVPSRIRDEATICLRPPRSTDAAIIPAEQRWVAAAPFRASFRMLVDATGLPWPMVAGLAHLPIGVATRLMGEAPAPRHRIRQLDAERICLLTPRSVRALRRSQVPAATARRRLRRLERRCSRAEVARRTGVARRELDLLSRASTAECSALTARVLHILEMELQESSVGPVSDVLCQSGLMPEAA